MWDLPGVESPILYLALFKAILAASERFWFPFRFLPLKPSFLYDHFTTQRSDFSSFLAVSTTDKPVNRSWKFLCKGGISLGYSQKQVKSSSNSDYRIQNVCGRKILSRTRTFGAEVHK